MEAVVYVVGYKLVLKIMYYITILSLVGLTHLRFSLLVSGACIHCDVSILCFLVLSMVVSLVYILWA